MHWALLQNILAQFISHSLSCVHVFFLSRCHCVLSSLIENICVYMHLCVCVCGHSHVCHLFTVVSSVLVGVCACTVYQSLLKDEQRKIGLKFNQTLIIVFHTCIHTIFTSAKMQSFLASQLRLKLVYIFQMMGIPRPGNLKSVLCEGTDLDQYIQFSSRAEKEAFQNVSCSLDPQQLNNAQQVLLQNLDARKVLSKVSCLTYHKETSPLF